MQGRDLVMKIKKKKKKSERGRYLKKKAILIKMGPISAHNSTIAPAFSATRVDLCGPLTL